MRNVFTTSFGREEIRINNIMMGNAASGLCTAGAMARR